MERWSLRAVVALAVAGAAGLIAIKTKGRRRALARGPAEPDPQAGAFASENMEATATGEGMPEAG